jgi:hypothetical protein
VRIEKDNPVQLPRPVDWEYYINNVPVASEHFMDEVERLPVQERESN